MGPHCSVPPHVLLLEHSLNLVSHLFVHVVSSCPYSLFLEVSGWGLNSFSKRKIILGRRNTGGTGRREKNKGVLNISCVCLPVCVSVYQVSALCSQKPEEFIGYARTRVTDGCELSHACWEANPGFLRELQALLTAEPSL